jgi:Glycosyltransferase like family 2
MRKEGKGKDMAVNELEAPIDTETSEVTLSLLICSRSDQYQGNSLWRLEVALNYVCQTVCKLGRENEVEVIVIDWGSKANPLSEVLNLVPEAEHIVSFLYVPPDVAKATQKDSPFPEVLALNAGVRHSKGKFVGRIDQDTLVGEQFLQTFFSMVEKQKLLVPLEQTMMLSNRRCIPYRVAVCCPSFWSIDRFVQWFGRWLPLMNPLPPFLWYQSFVGIWLLHRDIWHECGGYDERFIHMDWQEVDMMLRLSPKYHLVNLGELTDHDLYHLDHASPLGSWEAKRNRKANPVRNLEHQPEQSFPNDANWGLVGYPLIHTCYSSVGKDSHTVRQQTQQSKWLAYFTLITFTGIQIALDQVLLLTVIPTYKMLNRWYGGWCYRFRVLRERVLRKPMHTWPRLLTEIWTEKLMRQDPSRPGVTR